jgi:hypothetical protein
VFGTDLAIANLRSEGRLRKPNSAFKIKYPFLGVDMKFLVFLATVFSMHYASADQCQWNKSTDAESAKKLITGNDIIFWCQNCGEAKPSNIYRVLTVSTQKAAKDTNYRVVKVNAEYLVDKNGTELDLAYTYVRTASDIFTNVAQLVGCPSEGATTFIQTGPGRKKVAHFYDGKGQRVDVGAGTEDEIKFADKQEYLQPKNKAVPVDL